MLLDFGIINEHILEHFLSLSIKITELEVIVCPLIEIHSFSLYIIPTSLCALLAVHFLILIWLLIALIYIFN